MKLYLAGALFNEADVNQRKLEGRILRKRFPQIDVYNPIDEPFNQNKESLPSPEEIYEGDKKAVEDCDIFLCDVSVEDVGVAAELGMAIYTDTKIIIGINSDIRLTSANKYDVPTVGMNHFVLGAILTHGELARSFDEALDILEKKLEVMKNV